MPAFIPVMLLFAWHIISRGAAFGLGWATALFFGQIPGNKGRVVSVVALLGAVWVVLIVGAILPLTVLFAGQGLGVLPISGAPPDPLLLFAAVSAAVLLPPALVAFVEFAGFDNKRSFGRFVRRLPASYLLAGSIGLAVLQMIVVTPIVTLRRMREGRRVLQIPVVVQGRNGIQAVADDLMQLLETLGMKAEPHEFTGPMSWPLRTLRYAARHLIGSVVEGKPIRLQARDVELVVHATDVSITAPKKDVYRIRAAIERELAFSRAFLTWSQDSQKYEADLMRLCRDRDGDLDAFVEQLDRLQERIDGASLKSDEWNVLYRLRLQVERQARLQVMEGRSSGSARRKVQRTG